MRKVLLKGLILVVGVCLASAAFGQTVVQFGIQSAGPNNLAGVYTDPYNGVVGGGADGVGGTPVLAFCDDFTDEIGPPQYWTALDTNLNALSDSTTVNTVYYSGGASSPQTTDYIAVAMLAVESLENSSDALVQEEISFALWDIFDPTLLNSTNNQYGTLTQAELTAAQTYESTALTAAGTYSSGAAYEEAANVNVNIYSATTNGTTAESPGSGRPQEFITVTTPEPASAAILGFDLLSALAGVFLFRRYRVRAGVPQ